MAFKNCYCVCSSNAECSVFDFLFVEIFEGVSGTRSVFLATTYLHVVYLLDEVSGMIGFSFFFRERKIDQLLAHEVQSHLSFRSDFFASYFVCSCEVRVKTKV